MSISRYNTANTKQRYDGKTVLLTTYYPEINPTSNYIYIISSVSDRLDTLAYKYYADVSLWWIIAKANGLGKGGLSIPPGTQLLIPLRSSALGIIQSLNRLNK